MSSTVLVFGATGTSGREVVKQLAGKDVNVKAATRYPENYNAPAPNVHPVKLVQEDPATFSTALEGVDKAFVAAIPTDPAAFEKLSAFIDAAKAAGVRHIVFLSAIGVEHNDELTLRKVELHLQKSGIAFDILRPNFFMENFSIGGFSVNETHQITLPAADSLTSFISTEDIARVAAHFLLGQPGNDGYTLTGPEALDHHQVAALISEANGQQVKYVPLTEEEHAAALRAAGVPEPSIAYMGALFQAVRAGFMAPVTDVVKQITGQAPKDFKTFAAATWK
ncbi:NAD(P)H-binding protein [Chitinophaga pendula]|uniref:NmrA family NAD(P)-binding protein n=1 Tax=Chitinophaga TaxID=79328 RepID=UPI000BAFE166|nr:MULTISPECIES: NAD(P)H-binding protein [Chitinophaga]ASZ14340.1 hypothetical protein CK934_27035 [Chitinophaga sp. MD30]UCJ08010.1 NAD(P)H-binding protein [Chitinophaga pendula]